jgi:hypothetical protein
MAAAATMLALFFLLPTSYALIPNVAFHARQTHYTSRNYETQDELGQTRRTDRFRIVAYASTLMDVKEARVAAVLPEELASPVRDASFWLPRGALLVMAATCATNFPILSSLESIDGLAPSTVGTLRFLVALVPFLPTLLTGYGTTKEEVAETALPGLEIGAWSLVGYITQAIGLTITSAARGAFIGSMFMLVPPLVGGLSGKKVSTPTWVSVALALCGMAVLEGVMPGTTLSTPFYLFLPSLTFLSDIPSSHLLITYLILSHLVILSSLLLPYQASVVAARARP